MYTVKVILLVQEWLKFHVVKVKNKVQCMKNFLVFFCPLHEKKNMFSKMYNSVLNILSKI